MTLIIWINLSDRLYIWADTRLTSGDWSYIDNIIKIWHINDESLPVTIAVAGNLNFAKYMYEMIKIWIQQKIISNNIRILYSEIEDFCMKKTTKWIEDNNYSEIKEICIIFWWINNKNKKNIDIEKLKKLKKIHIDNIPSEKTVKWLKEQLSDDPVFLALLKKVPMERLMDDMCNPEKIRFNPKTEDLIKNNKSTLENNDSLIFSISISKNWIKKESAEWWDFLAYWTQGITKSHITDDFLAKMEVSLWSVVNGKDRTEVSDIRDKIIRIADLHNINEIWWATTTIVIRDSGYEEKFIYNNTSLPWWELIIWVNKFWDDYYYFKKWEEPLKLINFSEYSNDGEAQL